MYTAGGYSGTSSAGANVIPTIKAAEGLNGNIPFVLRTVSFTPDTECNIKLNEGTSINVKAGETYSNDEVLVGSFKIVEGSINYRLAFNY